MNPELPKDFVFTASNLQTFRTCKYKFYLRYIKRVPWPAQITMESIQFEADREAGVRFHHLLHQFFLGFDPTQLRLIAENDPDDRMLIWFETFLDSPYAHLQGVLEPEKTLRCDIDQYHYLAKFDLLQFETDRISIYDWKTSKNPPSFNMLKNSLQTKLYPLILSKVSQDYLAIQFVYWELNQPDQAVLIDITNDDLRHFEIEVTSRSDEISALPIYGFTKTDDFRRCAYCEYRSLCDRGVQAPSLKAIEEMDLFDLELYQETGNGEEELV